MASSYCKVLSRSFATSSVRSAIKRVTIVGGGQMGAGIAQVAAQTGHEVTLVDVSEDLLKKSKSNIETSLARVAKKKFAGDAQAAEKFISETLGRLGLNTDAVQAASNADIVIEAISEELQPKQKLFAALDKAAPSHALFASNTSSLSIKSIAESTSRQDRFGGLHFFNPVPVMKLVEVIRIPETSQESLKAFLDFGQAMEKTTIEAKDTPGFVVNRLLIPYMAEAVRMLERGVASPRDIDTAMKLGCGFPMGPFELIDYTGVDINRNALNAMLSACPDEPLFQPVPLIDKMVAEGKLGTKTGEGFYSYKKK